MVLETAISKYFVHKTTLHWRARVMNHTAMRWHRTCYLMTLIATVMKHVTTSPLMNSHQLTSLTSPARTGGRQWGGWSTSCTSSARTSRSSPPPILRTPFSAFDFFALFYYLILFMATLHHLYARSCGSVVSLGSYLCPSFIPLIASCTVFFIDSHLRVLDPSN